MSSPLFRHSVRSVRRALASATLLTATAAAGTAAAFTPSASAATEFTFGPGASFAIDQPRTPTSIFGFTDPGFYFTDPSTGQDYIPIIDIGALLDTGANGIILGQIAYLDENITVNPGLYPRQTRTDGSFVQFQEIGIAGTEFFDVLKPMTLTFTPQFSQTSPIVITNVSAMGAPGALENGPTAVIGMPAMIGRRVNVDISALLIAAQIDTTFPAAAPAPTGRDYHVNLLRRPHGPDLAAGKVQPDDPSPSYADLPLVPDVRVEWGTGSYTIPTMLLDTGAQVSGISTATALALGLDLDPTHATTDIVAMQEIGGIGGDPVRVPMVLVSRLVIPTTGGTDLVFTDLPVLVQDIADLGGIFGMNLFLGGLADEATETGYFYLDNVHFDFASPQWSMTLTANAEATAPGGPRVNRRLLARAPAGSTFTWTIGGDTGWSDTSAGDATSGYGDGGFFDGDFVTFGDAVAGRTIDIPAPVSPNWVTFSAASGENVVTGQAITGRTGLTKTGGSTVRLQNVNDYTGRTEVRGGTLRFEAPQTLGDVFVYPGGSLVIAAPLTAGKLAAHQGSIAIAPGTGAAVRAAAVAVSGGGSIDLGDHVMIVQTNPDELLFGELRIEDVLAAIEASAFDGRAGGEVTWAGPGIRSASAAADPLGITGVGVLLNVRPDGQPYYLSYDGVPLDTDSIILAYTYAGDLDLDGDVDADDYLALDVGFVNERFGYGNGDVNFDGVIDAADYHLIDKAFALQGPPILHDYVRAGGGLATAAPTAVPEPSALALLALAGGSLLARRRRREAGTTDKHG